MPVIYLKSHNYFIFLPHYHLNVFYLSLTRVIKQGSFIDKKIEFQRKCVLKIVMGSKLCVPISKALAISPYIL